jgi:hypothetical protein
VLAAGIIAEERAGGASTRWYRRGKRDVGDEKYL